jgi:hypothetical protein
MGESMSVCHCKDLWIAYKIDLIQIIFGQFVLIKKTDPKNMSDYIVDLIIILQTISFFFLQKMQNHLSI